MLDFGKNKLDIRGGISIKLINEPIYYFNLIGNIPEDVKFHKRLSGPVDIIHLFTKSRKELMVELPALRKYVAGNGAIWISWPKKSSNIVTDLDNDIIKHIGSQNNFAYSAETDLDENWSALKLEKSNGGN